MTVLGVSPQGYRRYSAPRRDGEAFIDPPIQEMGPQIDENRRLQLRWAVSIAGCSIATLQTRARAELLQAALDYTSTYVPNLAEYGQDRGGQKRCSPVGAQGLPRPPQSCQARSAAKPHTGGSRGPHLSPTSQSEILLSGHQPQLFHPGVWFKNFALAELAAERGARAINLVVDNDLCGSSSLRILCGKQGRWQLGAVAFDAPVPASIPYEQRAIEDWNYFASFAERLTKEIAGWNLDPTVCTLWPLVVEAGKRTKNLGLAVAQGRHLLEYQIGLRTLEVPLSRLAQTPSFFTLMAAVLQDLPRFQKCYNDSLVEYRAVHRIRSLSHPVPSLSHDGGWWETPYWVYGDRDPRRRPLWIRFEGQGVYLSDRSGREKSIANLHDTDSWVTQWMTEANDNFKVRPRALVTTMFARLLLGDYFLHGIGGAKYDQLGDRIVSRFFGLEAPMYGVVSGTVLLPIDGGPDLSCRTVHAIQDDLRDTRFSPEKFIGRDADPNVIALCKEKRDLVSEIPPRGSRLTWHRRVESLNAQISKALDGVRQNLRAELVEAKEKSHLAQWFQSREWSFALHPLQHLVDRFSHMLGER